MSIPSGKCPVCKQPFTQNDDIVICPECGAPYHRACYKQAGQCVFSDKHGTGFEYKDPQAAAKDAHNLQGGPSSPQGSSAGGPTIVCRSCNAPNPAHNIFCERCGAPLHAAGAPDMRYNQAGAPPQAYYAAQPPPVDMSASVDGISMKDWALYFGSASPTYLFRLKQQEERKSKVSLMLSAFFLGPYYFAYRKMWGWAAIAFVVWILLSVPSFLLIMKSNGNPLIADISQSMIDLLSQVAWVANLVYHVCCGMFAMYLYRRSAGKKIKALRSQYQNDGEYQAALASKGGTSVPGVLIFVVLLLILNFAVYPYVEADMLAYMSSLL